jgi:glycosyltransferase involved in cell wall biosynthesis
MPNVKFIFAGWDMGGYRFPHEHLNAGVLSLKELPDLYSQCDVGLVISFTNLSLLPLELMACGCVVVSNDGPNNEWLLNDSNCVMTESAPAKIAGGIIEILKNDEKRHELAQQAKGFAASTSWELEGERLHAILQQSIS